MIITRFIGRPNSDSESEIIGGLVCPGSVIRRKNANEGEGEMASEMVLEIILKTEDIGGFELYLWEKECARATIRKYLTDIHTFYRFLGEELHINIERLDLIGKTNGNEASTSWI